MKSWVKITIGLLLGIAFGLLLGAPHKIIAMVGTLFINLLKMLVGILVFSSIVTGICHIHDPKKLGRIGLRAIAYYVCSTLLAISVGILFAYWIQPGNALSLHYDGVASTVVKQLDLLDFIMALVPANPFAALVDGNVLQLITCAVLFALAIIFSGEKGRPVLVFLESLTDVVTSLTQIIMKMAPYAVFALIATSVGTLGLKVVLPLAKYLLCNYIACAIQVFIFFAIVIKYLGKLDLSFFFRGMKEAIVVAFTTCSSAATLPIAMRCVREELGISKEISGFVLSLGATVNMNGAAIGQSIAAVFVAQAYGIEFSAFQIVILFITTLLCAIGAAGVPGASIVMLSIIFSSLGLPLEGIALVAGVDRLREMVSTVVNILGDAVACVYVGRKEAAISAQTRFVHRSTV